MWTLGIWLEHWVENIAEKYVSENAYDRYEVDVRVQLVPGVRAHKLDRLEPEYLGTFSRQDGRRRGAPPTRLTTFTARSASSWKTFRRGHITINAAEIVRPPRPSVRPNRWSSFFASTRRNRSESQEARGALGGQGVR